MRVQVYAKTFEPGYKDTLIWEGEMDCVPRVGEQIFVFDGWGGVTVKSVYWELAEQTVEVSFYDRDGSYSDQANKLAVESLESK